MKSLSLFFIFISTPIFAQNSLKTYRNVTILEPQTIYLNGTLKSKVGGRNRTILSVKLPRNTVSWYYSFGATKDNAEIKATATLLTQLTRIYDQTGVTAILASNVVNTLIPPEGKSYCDVYLTDFKNAIFFKNKKEFKSYSSFNRLNFKSAVVPVDNTTNNEFYLCFANNSSTSGVYINIEVVATVVDRSIIIKTEPPPIPKTANEIEASSFLNIGQSYQEKGDTTKAMEYYNKVLAVDSSPVEHTMVTANIGLLQLANNEGDKAIETYVKYLTMLNEIKNNTTKSDINWEVRKDVKALRKRTKKNPVVGIKEVEDMLKQF